MITSACEDPTLAKCRVPSSLPLTHSKNGRQRYGYSFLNGESNGSNPFDPPDTFNQEIREGLPDYYELLKLDRFIRDELIAHQARTFAHAYHPDRIQEGNEEKFKIIQEAKEVLTSPLERLMYHLAQYLPTTIAENFIFSNGVLGSIVPLCSSITPFTDSIFPIARRWVEYLQIQSEQIQSRFPVLNHSLYSDFTIKILNDIIVFYSFLWSLEEGSMISGEQKVKISSRIHVLIEQLVCFFIMYESNVLNPFVMLLQSKSRFDPSLSTLKIGISNCLNHFSKYFIVVETILLIQCLAVLMEGLSESYVGKHTSFYSTKSGSLYQIIEKSLLRHLKQLEESLCQININSSSILEKLNLNSLDPQSISLTLLNNPFFNGGMIDFLPNYFEILISERQENPNKIYELLNWLYLTSDE